MMNLSNAKVIKQSNYREENKALLEKYYGLYFSDETLDFFKKAIVSQAKNYYQKNKKRANSVLFGDNQLAMLSVLAKNDPEMIPDNILIVYSGKKSKLEFR